jgi:hypothetical protein
VADGVLAKNVQGNVGAASRVSRQEPPHLAGAAYEIIVAVADRVHLNDEVRDR